MGVILPDPLSCNDISIATLFTASTARCHSPLLLYFCNDIGKKRDAVDREKCFHGRYIAQCIRWVKEREFERTIFSPCVIFSDNCYFDSVLIASDRLIYGSRTCCAYQGK